MDFRVEALIYESLDHPTSAVFTRISRGLAEIFPDKFILETESAAFDIEEYGGAGLCDVEVASGVHSHFSSRAQKRCTAVGVDPYNVCYDIRWEGQSFELINIGVQGDYCRQNRHFLVANDQAVAESFFLAVCAWNSEIRGEVLVFQEQWYKDPELFRAIRNSTLDNLVLEGNLKAQIVEDFRSFFESKGTYERFGIPWKRGVLLLGPPGNGKTHCIKALVNLLGVPCLYVRTFAARHETEQRSITSVFRRARESAPCFLIFEDLDSMVTDKNRSFFLNELDGFASNSGIVVIATTNHPERLDPALLNRPSRFDRKYMFHLPDLDCRARYLTTFGATLEEALRLSESSVAELAALTEGFSFAYLKELYLSAMMAWVHGTDRPLANTMREQIEPLRQQMATAKESLDVYSDSDEDDEG